MDYMSKGVKRVVWAAVAVLVVLSLPLLGASQLGRLLLSLGVPFGLTLKAPFYLVVLVFGLLVGYVVHRMTRAKGV